MLLPAAVGAAMEAHPRAFGWAVAGCIAVQAASYALLRVMPGEGEEQQGGDKGDGGGEQATGDAVALSDAAGAGHTSV